MVSVGFCHWDDLPLLIYVFVSSRFGFLQDRIWLAYYVMCHPLGQWNESGTLIDTPWTIPGNEGGNSPGRPRMSFSKERELDSGLTKYYWCVLHRGSVQTSVWYIVNSEKKQLSLLVILIKAWGCRQLLICLMFQELLPRMRWFSSGCISAQWPMALTQWMKYKATYLVFTHR